MMRRRFTQLAAALLVTSIAGCSMLTLGSLRVAVTAEPLNLSAAYEDESSALVGGLIHAGLYRPDASLLPQPLLADGAPLTSAGGTTIRVTLKSGLIFHDGSPLTSEDVAFTYQLAKSGQCPLAADICDLVRTRLEAVETDGPTAVNFRLISPWAPWRTRGLTIPILSKSAVEASLERFEESVGNADRALVTATRENILAQLEATSCSGNAANACQYEPYLGEMERVLLASGVELPDTRIFPALSGSGQAVTTRNDLAYARDLYQRLTTLEAYLLAPIESRLMIAYPLLDAQLAPVGAGPYVISERIPGRGLWLSGFRSFALGAPLIDRLFVARYVSGAAAVAAFQASQVDWVPNLTATNIAEIEVRAGGELLRGPSSRGYVYLAFNMRPGRPFADPIVRSALSSCIDLTSIRENAVGDAGIGISSTVEPSSWANPSPSPAESTYNSAAARAALLADGWTEGSDGVFAKLGTRLEGEILVRDGQSARLSAAQAIADQAVDCGFSITISAQPYSSEILPRLRYPSDFDAYLGGWQWSLDPDDTDLFNSAACPTEESPAGKNFVCWQSERADGLLRQALIGAREEARTPLYAELQALRRTDRPYLLLWGEAGYTLILDDITWPTRERDAVSQLYAWAIETWSK